MVVAVIHLSDSLGLDMHGPAACRIYEKGGGGGGLELGCEMKGISLHLAKRGSNNITSSFVATRTNMFPLYNPT